MQNSDSISKNSQLISAGICPNGTRQTVTPPECSKNHFHDLICSLTEMETKQTGYRTVHLIWLAAIDLDHCLPVLSIPPNQT
ncbi:hypothetical protein HanHA300_Chr13g0502371 [Helianthus annuus]|nr:hypothetical protein HanHA300_Chr13g0502371 [Helianthus annuus]KAJ0499532.1 hypothetical protein HanHA89_Chr13g0535101 [Helianthus annuus]